jgi:hypothetical protein
VTRFSALIFAAVVAVLVWMFAPMGLPELNEVLLIGADGWTGLTLHGREVMAIFAGIGVWIICLHFPERPKPIIFRHTATQASAH